MTKTLAPTVVANPRQDVLVAFPTGQPARQTTYSGLLYLGQPAAAAGMVSTSRRDLQFAGGLFLPDSLPYRSDGLAGSTVTADVWITSKSAHDYLLVDELGAGLVPDERDTTISWVQLGLRYMAASGSVLGYRVVVTADTAAVSD